MNDGGPLTPTAARALIVKILTEGGRVEFRPPARQEMAKDKITVLEALGVLRGGVVEPAERRSDEWRYRVRRSLVHVVVTFVAETHTAVVTAWRKAR
jgi:hypothetical protein